MSFALTADTLIDAANYLSGRNPDLAQIHEKLGPPPLWDREPGFPTLIHIVLETAGLAGLSASSDGAAARAQPARWL